MIQIYNGDCLELFKDVPDGSIDLVLCDPPYGTTKAKWDSIIDLPKMWKELNRVVKPNGAILLFGSQPFTSILISSNLKDFRYEWIWNKRKSANFLQANKQPHKIHENVCVFYKKQPTYNPIKVPNPAGEEKLKKMMAKLAKEKGYTVTKEEAIESFKGKESGCSKNSMDAFTGHGKRINKSDVSVSLPNSIITEDELKKMANAELYKDIDISNTHGVNLSQYGANLKKKGKFEYKAEIDKLLPNSIITEDELKKMANNLINKNSLHKKNSGGKALIEGLLGQDYYAPKETWTSGEVDKSLPNSVIEFKKDNYGKNIFHPTQKPVELLRYLIKTYSNEGETVLDFTMGSGSTGVAAKLEGRNFIGFEMNDKYFEIAKKRIEDADDK